MTARRLAQGTRWRRLATAYRYIAEAVDILVALAPALAETVRTASGKAFVILDGTLLPIDRIVADRPSYSGQHKKHGMNVQVIADPAGRLLWASPKVMALFTKWGPHMRNEVRKIDVLNERDPPGLRLRHQGRIASAPPQTSQPGHRVL
ncbi:hypothetical protein GCM10009579_03380 [Streptomyces javensis]|uniref:DDE Tnp4 domain-containing protein n=1 Tax=Streptomyces javensis TaxID=114698 RepID=A0ABP4H3G9_9ACTN